MKRWITAAAAAVLLTTTMSSSAAAFDDLGDVTHSQANIILQLRDQGIVNGIGDNQFAPHESMTAQQAIALIVRSLELSLAKSQFIKQPLASDSFTNIPDDAWFADAFVIASVNGLAIDRDIQPADPVTREQFIQWLMSAIDASGGYPFTEMFFMIDDEESVSKDAMNAIQRSLNGKIIELGESRQLRPQDPITRAEAAEWIHNAIQFINKHTPIAELAQTDHDPIQSGEITISIETMNQEIQKVTLSMGEKPHPGWGVRIEGIDFHQSNAATIRYSISYPNPNALYPMVITYPKAEAYLSSDITDIQYVQVSPGSP